MLPTVMLLMAILLMILVHATVPLARVFDSLYTYAGFAVILMGMLLILAGSAINLGTVSSLFVLPLFIWAVTKWHIAREENSLERIFGGQYLMYKRSVRRWI